ncbi:MAG: ferrochelatase [Hyphomicrobiales bacterium]|nr:ferrochelatase [Hyphomicrobiales bacterium]
MTIRRAVVLFNLGGPDNPESVRPFLYNLFSDPAIISLPKLPRLCLAWLISKRRAREAAKIYAHLGGKSPLLEETRAQAHALEAHLNKSAGDDVVYRVFVSMRYWHPRARETVAHVKEWRPDEIVLLPLYPQYSTTTTQSSMLEWAREAREQGLDARRHVVCCYPEERGFLRAHAEGIEERLSGLLDRGIGLDDLTILFSAHGLPEQVIRSGDPYQRQVERTCAGVMRELRLPQGSVRADWQVCYQSRVGPMAWIGPSIDEALTQAGAQGRGVVIVPIAFVSEHSETLVELDVEYRAFAGKAGVKFYERVPALGVRGSFITALGDLVARALSSSSPLCPQEEQPAGDPRCSMLALAPFKQESARAV